MKFNARCWKPPAAVLVTLMLWLSACATGGSDAQVACPPVVEYSAAEQSRAAAEVGALPENAMIVRMLGDYAVLRDQARACG
ncbi:hypothetical protein ACSSV6_003995 [Roseovarius sp. MBR-38]